MSRASALLKAANPALGPVHFDTVDEGYNPQMIKDIVASFEKDISRNRIRKDAVEAIKSAEDFVIEKASARDIGSGNIAFWLKAVQPGGKEITVSQSPVFAKGKGATAAAREEALIRIEALKTLQRKLQKNESGDVSEARKAYFDDDAELYSLSDSEIKKVVKSRGDYPMELVGDEAEAMAEYVENNGMGIDQQGGGYRVKYVFTPEALIEFLKAGRDGDLEEPLEELAGSIAETMKEYMDESLNEWFTDNQDAAFDVALLLLVNELKFKKHAKIANAISRKFKRNLTSPASLKELGDFFQDVNYADFSYMCSALEQGADEWRLKALLDAQKLVEKRGSGEWGLTILRIALAGTDKEQEREKNPFSKNLNKVSSDLAKLIEGLPKDFQKELREEYYLDIA